MKNIKISAIIASAAAFFFGCENFTEVDMPQSQLTGAAVFTEVGTADAALTDIYARMREGGMPAGVQDGLSSLMGNYSDELTFYGSSVEIEQFYNHTVAPSNFLVSLLWSNTYGQIYATNALLEGVENSTALSAADRDRIRGEALFIRGYLHFYLVNVFGDVPYIKSTDYELNARVSRMPAEQVWSELIADVLEAETLLPAEYPTAERVRANKAVAAALLARINLYRENWSAAEAKATEVINNAEYVWQINPASEFLRDNPSIIWALHPGAPNLNTRDARTFLFSSGPPTKSALSENIVNAFETGDIRRTLWVRTVTNAAGTWYCSFKYKRNLGTTPSQEYTILFRLAEQYLIRAEARAHLGDISGAQADLNMVRNRAALPNTTASTVESLLDAIAQERKVELFTEQGHRWFDLKRTGKAPEVLAPLKPGWDLTRLLLPFPESELLLNSNLLPQNPGY